MSYNFLIYQAHSAVCIYEEALYSILSFMHVNSAKTTKIVVYTDDATFFEQYLSKCTNVEYIPITRQTIDDWAGDFNFVHRIKIKMLLDAVSRFNGNILYLDTDTYIQGNLEHYFDMLQNDNYIMHRLEWHFAKHKSRLKKKYRKAFHKTAGKHAFDVNFGFWNAGVLGFNTRHKNLVTEVLEFNDNLFEHCRLHTVEQMSFSYIMSKYGHIVPIEPVIYHYWNFKDFRQIVSQYLKKYKNAGPDELIRNVENINPARLHKPKLDWEKKSSLSRRLGKMLFGKTWELPEYTL